MLHACLRMWHACLTMLHPLRRMEEADGGEDGRGRKRVRRIREEYYTEVAENSKMIRVLTKQMCGLHKTVMEMLPEQKGR